MNPLELRLKAALSLALTSGLALTACDPVTPTGNPGDTDDTGTVGTTPADLATVCAGEWLDYVTLAEPVDYLAHRRTPNWGADTGASGEELYTSGTPCGSASDATACLDTLATTWPSPSGWGYCGEGCSDSGLVTTAGDDVRLYDSTAEVVQLFGAIDTPADALFLALTQEYAPECASVVQLENGDWQLRGTIMISDCEWVDEVRDIHIAQDGTTTVLHVVEVIESGACAGRLPDGIVDRDAVCGDAVAQHLAHLAWLEGAAVVAFERLAVDLARHNAPSDLIARARAAARDEVEHASRMGALAQSFGATVPAVEVDAHADRSLYDIALENAVEGCVRETYGVVDALYRSERSPLAEVRRLFARIAEDETRHAALSWDVAQWAQQHLTATEAQRIAAAADTAHDTLVTALSTERADVVQQQLGAPPAHVAVVMAQSLRQQLAA